MWLPFSGLRSPKEVKACLRALEELRPLFSQVLCADTVLRDVQFMTKRRPSWPSVIDSVRNHHISPRDSVLFAIVHVSSRLVSGGQHHIYRGVLDMEGHDFHVVFNIALTALVQSGFATEDQAREQREALAAEIAEWG